MDPGVNCTSAPHQKPGPIQTIRRPQHVAAALRWRDATAKLKVRARAAANRVAERCAWTGGEHPPVGPRCVANCSILRDDQIQRRDRKRAFATPGGRDDPSHRRGVRRLGETGQHHRAIDLG